MIRFPKLTPLEGVYGEGNSHEGIMDCLRGLDDALGKNILWRLNRATYRPCNQPKRSLGSGDHPGSRTKSNDAAKN